MPHDPYRALYIHIPFCASRCLYCDFTTEACPADSAKMDAYVENLCVDIRRLAKEGELAGLKTIYIGGGTPTHLGSARLTQLLYMLSLSITLEQIEEFTVEANPESLTEAMVKDIWALGVNRLSIGVQSFDDKILTLLDRAHDAAGAETAIHAARTRFENVSVDLMCGIPGQSDASFEASLRRAIGLGVKHLSVYPLTVEEGTPLAKAIRRGRFPQIDEDDEARHMELAERVLGEAGFVRYEVANYALPGYESRHNSAYWSGVPYLGLGRSAVTMTQNAERRMRKQDGYVTDDLNPKEMLAEDLMLAMRMSRGVSTTRVADAERRLPGAQACFEELCRLGLVRVQDEAFVPTERGWLCGNELYGRIFDLA